MNAQAALQRVDELQPVRQEPKDLLQLAVERGASVETLERLMAVRRELRAESAKTAFDTALAAFQSECPVIRKGKAVLNKDGKSTRYKYAPLDSIVSQVKPLLQKHGFSYAIDTKVETASVAATCKVTHRDGHSETSTFQVPIDKDSYMNNQQQFASALTFAKRYAFVNALGILTGDQDNDAGGSDDAPTPFDLRKRLWGLLTPVVKMAGARAWEGKVEQWLIDECNMDPSAHVREMDAKALLGLIDTATRRLKELGL